MHVIGWAVDTLADAPASAVLLYIDDSNIYRTTYGLDSWQSVEKLHNRKYRFSGFDTLISTKDLNPGGHSLTMKVVSKNNRFLYNTDVNIRFIVLDH